MGCCVMAEDEGGGLGRAKYKYPWLLLFRSYSVTAFEFQVLSIFHLNSVRMKHHLNHHWIKGRMLWLWQERRSGREPAA